MPLELLLQPDIVDQAREIYMQAAAGGGILLSPEAIELYKALLPPLVGFGAGQLSNRINNPIARNLAKIVSYASGFLLSDYFVDSSTVVPEFWKDFSNVANPFIRGYLIDLDVLDRIQNRFIRGIMKVANMGATGFNAAEGIPVSATNTINTYLNKGWNYLIGKPLGGAKAVYGMLSQTLYEIFKGPDPTNVATPTPT